MRALRAGALVLLMAPAAAAQPRPSAGTVTFEALWAHHVAAEMAGDAEAAAQALQAIRRMRVERNVDTAETVGLGMVLRGLERLGEGDRQGAEEAFRGAVVVAPGLPDSHFGLASALRRKGPLGLVPGLSASVSGVMAFLNTGRGRASLAILATMAWLVFVFLLGWTVAFALLLRKGGLLWHDIEEWLGPAQSRATALALVLSLLLLPAAVFQGWGWLPVWWMALLLAYLGRAERAAVALLAVCVISVGPMAGVLESTVRTLNDPLYDAALSAVEGVPDRAALGRLERAWEDDPEDRDLAYLLGEGLKHAGEYERAAALYQDLLAKDAGDAYARNNLAGIEFARGEYDAALARYREGTRSEDPKVAATSFYNLSIAYLQKFDYEAFNEAKVNADRLARGLVAQYERWKYDTGDYAVVDLSLGREEVWTKFSGASDSVAVRNVVTGGERTTRVDSRAGSVLNRFAASIGLMVLVGFAVARWRGPKAFTVHCGKCGMAFCRYCHLGQAGSGLCSQCYHLFVVRDGVSGPARNRKLSEVQEASGKRDRVFRVLSLLAPGTGHIYAGRPLVGLALLAPWYAILALLAASRVAPLTGASSMVVPTWPLWVGGSVLAVLWLGVNRLRRPELEAALPTRGRPGPRRARTAQGA